MTRACPFCAESIEAAAIKCKHCGEFLDVANAPKPATPVSPKPGLQCPRCQSTEIKRRSRYLQPAFTVLVIGVVMSFPFPDLPDLGKQVLSLPLWVAAGIALFGKSYCTACDHRWR